MQAPVKPPVATFLIVAMVFRVLVWLWCWVSIIVAGSDFTRRVLQCRSADQESAAALFCLIDIFKPFLIAVILDKPLGACWRTAMNYKAPTAAQSAP